MKGKHRVKYEGADNLWNTGEQEKGWEKRQRQEVESKTGNNLLNKTVHDEPKNPKHDSNKLQYLSECHFCVLTK